MELKDFSNIPFRLSALADVFPDISEMSWKAKRLERNGEIVRLKRGLFVVAPRVSGIRINDFLLANHISGPSYVSMHAALRYYGLIPETVYRIASISVGLSKTFDNTYGTFEYIHCSNREYFSIGIRSVTEDDTTFLVASPEKALCDLLTYTPNLNLRYTEEVRAWLEDDMRFDMDDLVEFNLDILNRCAVAGRKKTMINKIIKIIENERYV